MKPLAPRILILALCIDALASCGAREVRGFSWTDSQGGSLSMSELGPSSEGFEGRFGPARTKGIFVLSKPRGIESSLSIELGFRPGPLASSANPPELEIGLSAKKDGSEPFLSQTFVVRSPLGHLVLPLPSGSLIQSFSVALRQKEASSPSHGKVEDGAWLAELIGMKEMPLLLGIERSDAELRISAGVSVFRKGAETHLLIDSPALGELAAMDASAFPGKNLGILVDYTSPGREGMYRLDSGGRQVLSAMIRPRGVRTVLPVSMLVEGANRAELVLPAGVDFRAFQVGWLAKNDAELADFGTVLRAPQHSADHDYDLCRWDLMPSVLIFDFKDYAAQDRYLKRLAFFVEKQGFKGRLAGDGEIADLHGWNAHDYRPEDLADFFETARKLAFALSESEIALRKLLVERGIVLEKGGSYTAGSGAIISISRESLPYQRVQLLTHESTHAIFFEDEDYRGFVRHAWASMGKDEKWFWRLYFGWMNYDTSDDYLMANEYQAYLLQQVLPLVSDYFTKTLPIRLEEKHAELVPRIDAYMKEYGSSFERHARELDSWLGEKYGFRAGKGGTY